MHAARLVPVLALVAFAAGPPASAAEKPKPRVVLVEADGSYEELSAFVARLESELSDGGKLSFSDARLSGATLGSLVAEPGGEAVRAFRAEWPGETWLAVSLSPCHVEVSRMQYSDTTPEGYRVLRVVENVRVDCAASFRLVDATTGKEGKLLAVTGTASYRRNEGEEEESSELEGTRDAARKAAKKLPSLLKK
jgi:hypothetical protein